MIRSLVNRFFGYFIRGLLFVAPVGLTILLLYNAFDFVDSIFRIRFNHGTRNEEFFVPGLGFLIVTLGTAFVGFVFTSLIPGRIQIYLESGLSKLPFVNIFYSAFKDLVSAFVGDKKKFKTPVLLHLNLNSNIYKLGFITQSDLEILSMPEMVSVYCPHSYAFSGELFIVPKDQIKILNISSADAMKMIVSGGVSIKSEE
jgi:uncharacterized membrane protein